MEIVEWNAQSCELWQSEFVACCQKEWVEPLWKWCNQIYQSSSEGHTQLQQSLHRQEEQRESVRATLPDRVQKLEVATRQSCDRLSAEVQEVLTQTNLNLPTLYKFEHENRTNIQHLDEHYNQVLNLVGDHQNEFQRTNLQLVGRVENLKNSAKKQSSARRNWGHGPTNGAQPRRSSTMR